jgi:hypothetical protein
MLTDSNVAIRILRFLPSSNPRTAVIAARKEKTAKKDIALVVIKTDLLWRIVTRFMVLLNCACGVRSRFRKIKAYISAARIKVLSPLLKYKNVQYVAANPSQ